MAATFYELRRSEIRPDIIQCFSDLGYDINEPINNVTPIQHYCDLSKEHYIMPSIIESFIKIGKAKINHFIGRKQTVTISQLIANSDAKVKYEKLDTLKMMIDKFNVKLDIPKKRKQDICYVFTQRYHDQVYLFEDFFDKFI